MIIVYLFLGVLLLSTSFIIYRKKETLSKCFKRQSLVVNDLYIHLSIIYSIIGVICIFCSVLLLFGISLSKWIAILIILSILISSMIISFRLLTYFNH